MTRAREREDEGCSLPKSAEKISCFIAGGGGGLFFLIYSTEMSRYRLNRIDCVKNKKGIRSSLLL